MLKTEEGSSSLSAHFITTKHTKRKILTITKNQVSMEYNELQIGDWVLTPWEVPIKVKEAHNNHIETEVKNGHTWSFGKNYHCSPIPLTPEILEKNGFKNNVGVCFHDFDTVRGKCRIGWNADTHVVYVGYAEIPTYIINVHEFQSLLRAIGLRNIADNFIV